MSPFVLEEIRAKIRELGFGESDAVGDLCFIVYAEMMRRWNESPRWTTIHYLKKEFVRNQETSEFLQKVRMDLALKAKLAIPGIFVTAAQIKDVSFSTTSSSFLEPTGVEYKFDTEDLYTAADLAFEVFMHFHGIEYEKKKREENGDIL